MNEKTPEIYFYFDSKNIFSILINNQLPRFMSVLIKVMNSNVGSKLKTAKV